MPWVSSTNPASPRSVKKEVVQPRSPRSGSASPTRNKLKQNPSKVPKADMTTAETTEAERHHHPGTPTHTSNKTGTPQPTSGAKRLSASDGEQVLQLVQKYLPPEDQQMLQQQQQNTANGNDTTVSDEDVQLPPNYSTYNPLYRTTAEQGPQQQQQQQQAEEVLIAPLTQAPASISRPCGYAQPVSIPELRALSRSNTAGSTPGAWQSDTTTAQQQTSTAAAATSSGTTAQNPFATSTPAEEAVPTAATAAAGEAVATVPVASSIWPLSSTLLPAVGTSEALSSDVLSVLGAWYAMYCPDREVQLQAALMTHYDTRARFEDNFIQAFGREQIGVQFYGMRRLVKGIDLIIEKVEVLSGEEQTTTASGANPLAGILSTLANKPQSGTYQIRVVIRIAFHLPALIRGPVTSWFLPPALEAWATDILTVRQADNKIVHHQQRVHNIPVGPWPLRAYVGVTSSLFMMHVLGW